MKRFRSALALIALVFAFVSPDTRAATGLSSPVLTNFNLLSFNIVGTGPPTNMIQLNLDLSQFDPGPLRIKSSYLTNVINQTLTNFLEGVTTTNYTLVAGTNMLLSVVVAGTNETFTMNWIPVVDKLQVTNLTVINLTNTFQTNVNQIFTNIIVTNITFEGPAYFTTNAAPIFYSTTIFTNVEIFEYSTTNFFQNILNVYNSVTNGGDTIVNNYTNTTWNLSSNYFFFDPLTVIRIAGNTYITNGPVNIINAPITITNGPITTYITNGPAISIFVTNGPGITINNTPVAVLDTNTFNPTQFIINPTNMVNFKAGAHVTNLVNTGTIALSGSSYTFPLGVPMAGGLLVNPATNLDVLQWQGSQQFPISQTVFFTTTTNPAIVIYPGGNTNTPIIISNSVAINPTDGYIPYRSNATTFGDSPLERAGATTLYVHNTSGGNTLWFFDAGDSTLAQDGLFEVTKNNVGSASPISNYGFIASNPYVASPSLQQNSPAMTWLGGGWGTNSATSQSVFFGAYVVPAAGSDKPSGQWLLQAAISNTVPATVLAVSAASGYTGTGANFLSDDGTYKAAGGGGVNYWTNTVVSGVTNLQPIDLTTQPLLKNGLMIGTNAILYSSAPLTNGEALFAWNDVSQGDPDNLGFTVAASLSAANYSQLYLLGDHSQLDWIARYQNGSDNWKHVWEVSLNNLSYSEQWNGTNLTLLQPTAQASVTPYLLDTSLTHTNGNLLEVANSGTNQFTVAANSGYTGTGTNFLSDDGTYKAAGVTATNITYGFFDFDGATHGYTNTAAPTIIDFGGTKMQTPGLAPGYYLVTVSLNAYFPVQPHNLDPTLIDCEIAIIDSEIGTATPGSLKTAWLSYNGTNDPPFSSFIPMTTQGLCQILTNGSTISVQGYCLAVSGIGPTASVVDKTGATISYIKVQ